MQVQILTPRPLNNGTTAGLIEVVLTECIKRCVIPARNPGSVTDLTGSTGVTFNGTAATFTVVSASQIMTTVPEGATTGDVEVVPPGGTLKSNMKFRVTP